MEGSGNDGTMGGDAVPLALALAEALDQRTKQIILKSSSSNLSTSEITHLLEQAQRWRALGGRDGLGALISTARPARPTGESCLDAWPEAA